MAFSRRQIATFGSALYLAALTALSAYALQQINHLSIPIPNLLTALTVALPPLIGVAASSFSALDEHLSKKSHVSTTHVRHIVIMAFTIYEVVIATLAGTHLAPENKLVCGLQDQWRGMWMSKDVTSIKLIQDALKCCGFGSMKDMAWPFPDKHHGADACLVRYADERNRSCMEVWRGREKSLAGILLAVAIGVFMWKIFIFSFPSSSSPWLASPAEGRIHLSIEEGNGHDARNGRKRPSIGYRDDPDSRDDDESLAGEVERLNTETNLSTRVESSRVQPSQLWHNEHQWTREQERV